MKRKTKWRCQLKGDKRWKENYCVIKKIMKLKRNKEDETFSTRYKTVWLEPIKKKETLVKEMSLIRYCESWNAHFILCFYRLTNKKGYLNKQYLIFPQIRVQGGVGTRFLYDSKVLHWLCTLFLLLLYQLQLRSSGIRSQRLETPDIEDTHSSWNEVKYA